MRSLGSWWGRRTSSPQPGAGRSVVKRREIHARPDRPWRRWGMFALVGVLVVVVGGSAFALWQLNANITRIDVSSAIGWFKKHGQVSVLVCRCIPIVRSLISIPAGISGRICAKIASEIAGDGRQVKT